LGGPGSYLSHLIKGYYYLRHGGYVIDAVCLSVSEPD